MYTFHKVNGERGNLTILEDHLKYILEFCNFDFFNVGESFVIQLFDKEYYSNDQVDCIAEFDNKNIDILISQTIKWINTNKMS